MAAVLLVAIAHTNRGQHAYGNAPADSATPGHQGGSMTYSAASMRRCTNAIHLLLHIRVLGNETRSCGL